MDWTLEENHAAVITALGIVSAITFVGSLILIPILITRMPTDYFRDPENKPESPWAARHPVLRWMLLIAKNVLGAVLLAGGIVMLVLPGQGLLTMIMGLVLMNYPGKRRIERYLVTRRAILRTINWIRKRSHRPPLEFDSPDPDREPTTGG